MKVGIVGLSGYSGCELLKLLLNHKKVCVTYVAANTTTGKVSAIWPQLKAKTNLFCEKFNANKAAAKCDIVFLAVPHTVSMKITPALISKGVRVIDLSGDYRLKNKNVYKTWYGKTHTDHKNLSKAVYGFPEIFRQKIKKAKLLSNPGCYPTGVLLGLIPIAATRTKSIQSIIIDAKSGTSGAGKKAKAEMVFSEVNESCKAYKVGNHQHTPEIEQYLSHIAGKNMQVTFVPHLLPINRGILSTIYVKMENGISLKQLHLIYKNFYKTEKFVRILPMGVQPEIKNVTHTNYCDIGLAIDKKKKMLIITSVIDNLVKGAAGQAIQNMNIMCNFKEQEGLL